MTWVSCGGDTAPLLGGRAPNSSTRVQGCPGRKLARGGAAVLPADRELWATYPHRVHNAARRERFIWHSNITLFYQRMGAGRQAARPLSLSATGRSINPAGAVWVISAVSVSEVPSDVMPCPMSPCSSSCHFWMPDNISGARFEGVETRGHVLPPQGNRGERPRDAGPRQIRVSGPAAEGHSGRVVHLHSRVLFFAVVFPSEESPGCSIF